jgi:hypothetical protein
LWELLGVCVGGGGCIEFGRSAAVVKEDQQGLQSGGAVKEQPAQCLQYVQSSHASRTLMFLDMHHVTVRTS